MSQLPNLANLASLKDEIKSLNEKIHSLNEQIKISQCLLEQKKEEANNELQSITQCITQCLKHEKDEINALSSIVQPTHRAVQEEKREEQLKVSIAINTGSRSGPSKEKRKSIVATEKRVTQNKTEETPIKLNAQQANLSFASKKRRMNGTNVPAASANNSKTASSNKKCKVS